jgi:hypothetical protein
VPSAEEFLSYVAGLVSDTLDYYGLDEQGDCDRPTHHGWWHGEGQDEDGC